MIQREFGRSSGELTCRAKRCSEAYIGSLADFFSKKVGDAVRPAMLRYRGGNFPPIETRL